MPHHTEPVQGYVRPARGYWYYKGLGRYSEQVDKFEEIAAHNAPGQANLIGSRLPDGTHAPVLDLDFPAELVPSRTPGHFHLYLDKVLSWDQYRIVLAVLMEVGIIQQGYYLGSVKKGQTMLRTPRVKEDGSIFYQD